MQKSLLILTFLLTSFLSLATEVTHLKDELKNLNHEDKTVQIHMVNAIFNSRMAYQPDTEDEWLSLEAFITQGAGDCEDFAIAKYLALKALGFNEDELRLVYARNNNQAHMVLVVTMDNEQLVLDNITNAVLPAENRLDLEFVFSFNQEKLWAGISMIESSKHPRDKISKWNHLLNEAGYP